MTRVFERPILNSPYACPARDEERTRLLFEQQLNEGKNSAFKHVGDSGVLVAIILARKDYVGDEWGERATTPNYRAVSLEALQPQGHTETVPAKPDEIQLSISNGIPFVPVKIIDRLILDFVIDRAPPMFRYQTMYSEH